MCVVALQGLIGLHLLAIVFTSWRQRSNLVTRMLPAMVFLFSLGVACPSRAAATSKPEAQH